MSKLETNQVDPATGTTLTLGTSGDTISIPSGVTLANSGTATGFGISNLTPAFMMRRASDQTGLADDTATKLVFDTDYYDSNSATDTSTGRFTVPSGEGGNYYIFAAVGALAAGQIRGGSLQIYKNGSALWYPQWQFGSAQSQGIYPTYGIVTLSAADYVEIYAKINVDSGTSDAANSNGYNTYFGGFKIS